MFLALQPKFYWTKCSKNIFFYKKNICYSAFYFAEILMSMIFNGSSLDFYIFSHPTLYKWYFFKILVALSCTFLRFNKKNRMHIWTIIISGKNSAEYVTLIRMTGVVVVCFARISKNVQMIASHDNDLIQCNIFIKFFVRLKYLHLKTIVRIILL